MKILVISQYFYPEQFLINEVVSELVRRGNEVTVLTGLPNYPEGVISNEYKHGKKRLEVINGVNVVRCPIVGRGHNKVTLLINYFSYMFEATRKVRKIDQKFDVVYLYQLTPIFQAYPAIKYCKMHDVPLVCYCLDLAPKSGDKIISKLRLIGNLYRKFSKWAYSSCDHIAVTSKAFITYLNDVHSIPFDRMSYLPQHASEKMLNVDLNKVPNDYFDFMFAGNIGMGASLDTILFAVEKLNKEGISNFRVHFVGNGSYKNKLIEMTNLHQLNKLVIFHDAVTITEMPIMYKLADVLLITLRKNQITVPGKLQTYMATGKPIFGAMDKSGQSVIQEAKCGVCVDAEDVGGLAKIMKDYILHSENYNECGTNGKRYFRDNFTLDKHIKGLISLLENEVQKDEIISGA